MSWEDRIIDDRELKQFFSDRVAGAAIGFRSRVRALIRQQLAAWPMLREAVTGLSQVEYKKLAIGRAEVLVQYNPKRIVSATARVDQATISRRPCFLCVDNLPAEEKGVTFGRRYVVLCNPFPVLPDHLVISSREHTPQAIDNHFGDLLDLSREFGDGWFTLYNGPRCGASAPDHLHFQACHSGSLPILREIERSDGLRLFQTQSLEVRTLRDYPLNLLFAVGKDRDELIAWFAGAINRLAETMGEVEEPMVNLVVAGNDQSWSVIIFPRGRHRPSCYHAEGQAKLTVSPAAIDLSGVLIAPERDHFARITARDVEQIFAEVTLGRDRFDRWINQI